MKALNASGESPSYGECDSRDLEKMSAGPPCQRSPQQVGHEPDAGVMSISQRSTASSVEMKSDRLVSH